MPKLTQIQLEHFRGSTAAYRIKPITVFTGPNGAGKTTALDAVAEVLAGDSGRFPWLQSEIEAPVRASLTFHAEEHGITTIQRTFAPDHNAAVMPGPIGIKKTKARIAAMFGNLVFDSQTFLDLSPEKRNAALLELAAAVPESLPNTPEDGSKEIGGISEDEIPTYPGRAAGASTVNAWIAESIKRLDRVKRAADKARLRINREIESKAAVADAEPLDGSLEDAKTDQAAKSRELAHAEAALEMLESIGGSIDSAKQRIAELAAEAFEAGEQYGQITTDADLAKTFNDRLAPLDEIRQSYAAKLEALDKARQANNEIDAEVKREQARFDAAVLRVSKAAGVVSAFSDGEPCPTCARALDPDCDGYEAAVSAANVARQGFEVVKAQLETLRSVAADIADDGKVAADAEFNAREAAQAAARESQNIQDQFAAAKKAAADRRRELQNKISSSERSAAELRSQLEKMPSTTADPEIAKVQVKAAKKSLDRADAVLAAHSRAQAREEEIARTIRERDEVEDTRQDVKKTLELLKRWRTEIVQAGSAAILAFANDLFTRVFPHMEIALDDENETGAHLIFKRSDAVKVPPKAWSGSETMVAAVACHLAMLKSIQAKWRVLILDNVDRMTPDTFARFLWALNMLAHAGELDNAIVAGTLDAELVLVEKKTTDGGGRWPWQKLEIHRLIRDDRVAWETNEAFDRR
jgi:DNA repair exonuclease SbcCD ATPase subunit